MDLHPTTRQPLAIFKHHVHVKPLRIVLTAVNATRQACRTILWRMDKRQWHRWIFNKVIAVRTALDGEQVQAERPICRSKHTFTQAEFSLDVVAVVVQLGSSSRFSKVKQVASYSDPSHSFTAITPVAKSSQDSANPRTLNRVARELLIPSQLCLTAILGDGTLCGRQ